MADNDLFLVMAAVGGVIRATETAEHDRSTLLVARWVILATLIVSAAVAADSVRGFMYLLMMPIGCFKVGQVLAEPVIYLWRARQPKGSNPPR